MPALQPAGRRRYEHSMGCQTMAGESECNTNPGERATEKHREDAGGGVLSGDGWAKAAGKEPKEHDVRLWTRERKRHA